MLKSPVLATFLPKLWRLLCTSWPLQIVLFRSNIIYNYFYFNENKTQVIKNGIVSMSV